VGDGDRDGTALADADGVGVREGAVLADGLTLAEGDGPAGDPVGGDDGAPDDVGSALGLTTFGAIANDVVYSCAASQKGYAAAQAFTEEMAATRTEYCV
jgi:hypothetical protein